MNLPMDLTDVPVFHFDTNYVAKSHRIAGWRSCNSIMSEISLPAQSDPLRFRAALTELKLKSLIFRYGHADAYHMVRSAPQIHADAVDAYALLVLDRGVLRGVFDGRPGSAAAGVPLLLDLARPIDADITESRFVSVRFARPLLGNMLPQDIDVHGLALRGASATLLAQYVLALPAYLPRMASAERAHVPAVLRGFLAASIAGRADPADAAEQALLSRTRDYILIHLSDPGLNPARICNALGMSRSSLYRVLKPLGGVTRYVRDCRLARIRQTLVDPAEQRLISSIAAQYGFSNMAHFSRAFRAAYGCSPSETRSRATSTLKS